MSDEVVLPRRAVPQPRPAVCAGGDCGACCLGGLLGLPIPAVYHRLRKDAEAFTFHDMRQALWSAGGMLDRIVEETPIWVPCRWPRAPWGIPGPDLVPHWFGYLRMAVDAGYYGLAEVHHAGGGYPEETDHWVLLCGAREVEPPPGGGAILQQVLVSCPASSPEGRWVDAGDLLLKHGAYSALLARPAPVAILPP